MIPIDEIFVGREEELKQLQILWNKSLLNGEHKAYVMLNAPGVGKTSLLHHFGKQLESKNQCLFLSFHCSLVKNYHLLIKSFLNLLQNTIDEKKQEINIYLHQTHLTDKDYCQKQENKLKRLRREIEKTLDTEDYTFDNLKNFLYDISAILPCFFMIDEVQRFQESILSTEYGEETALHYITQLISGLLDRKIMFVLSGTRYTILSQIGINIGSPIIGKVNPIIISKLSDKDLILFKEKVYQHLISDGNAGNYKLSKINLLSIMDYFSQFLKVYSGGHGRTIEKITFEFDSYLQTVAKNDSSFENITYANFEYRLLQMTSSALKLNMLNSKQTNAIKSLQSNIHFTLINNWFLKGLMQNLSLGVPPHLINADVSNSEKDNISDLIYELMNIGVVIQNGNNDYYNTSYFHIKTFLDALVGPYKEFLSKILNNKFFGRICGSHGGFGYTFENILINAIMMRIMEGSQMNYEGFPKPIDLGQIIDVSNFYQKELNWDAINSVLKPNIFYHTPSLNDIDLILIQKNQLLLTQITSAATHLNSKFSNFKKAVNMLAKNQNMTTYGWFITFFPLDLEKIKNRGEKKEDTTFFLTTTPALIPLLGAEIHEKLKQIKVSIQQEDH
jgi:AAA ATPase-like protein